MTAPAQGPRCKIVIPVYRPLGEAELGLIAHNVSTLGAYPAVLIGGQGQADLLNDVQSSLFDLSGQCVLVELFDDQYFDGIAGYNRLLTEPGIYERFADVPYVLICQHDAIILRSELDSWLDRGYAFVGAPMFVGYSEPVRPLKFLKTLNGGLSLRHIPSALRVFRNTRFLQRTKLVRLAQKLGLVQGANRVLSQFGEHRVLIHREDLNEDVFWTGVVPASVTDFRLPTPDEAAGFAFEACPADLFERTGGQLPFGCHAFERYDPAFWIANVPDRLVAFVSAISGQSKQ